jgi:ubiquinone/menaquinone biosynthesis C-methylase UbiE
VSVRRRGPDRRLFDVWSLFYDAPLVQRFTYRPEHDSVLRALRPLSPVRVLDLGCGTGQLASRIHEELQLRATGCDFSPGMLARARERDPALPFVRGDAGRLPFADRSFDAVVSTEAFHWFPSQADALAEIRRVLGPGGHALISLVNPPTELMSRWTRLSSRLSGNPFHMPTRARMRRLVEDAGLHVESQRLVFRAPLTLAFPSVLTVARRVA